MSDKITTYKGVKKDLTAYNNFQYEIDKTEKDDGAIRCGGKGFHSCEAPMDVLRYYPLRDGNRYFECEAGGQIDRAHDEDTKLASSELTLKAEIGLPGLIKAQVAYTRKKSEEGTSCGDRSNLASGDDSNLAGGDGSNLAGGNRSNLAGGSWSNLAGGDRSNLAGGNRSNLAGGYGSNLAGGDRSLIVGRTGCKVKGGKNSVLVLTEWDYVDGEYKPVTVSAVVVDGDIIKADTWYTLKDGVLVEA